MIHKKRGGGQITYRCDLVTYEQLTTAALLLKEDVNSVLNRLVLDGLPGLLREAREKNRAYLATTLKPDEDYLPVGDEVLRRILVAGRTAPPSRKGEAMENEARKAYRPKYPTREMLVGRALQIEKLVERLYLAERMTREASGPEEVSSVTSIAGRLRAELARHLEDWKTFLHAPASAGPKPEEDEG